MPTQTRQATKAAAAIAALTTAAACGPAQAQPVAPAQTGGETRIADLPVAQTIVNREVHTSRPTVIEGEKVCADSKPDLTWPADGREPTERWRIAHIIWDAADHADAPIRARVIAYAAAIQESSLEDLAGGHADSQGPFQMRGTFPDQWGTYAQLDDPAYQARRFFVVLFNQNGDWREDSVTEAAQDVLVSAFPNAYADHVDEAARIVGWLSQTPCHAVVVDIEHTTTRVV